MTNLPNAHLAVVEQEKVCGYLLNPAHPDNGGKAEFFVALGFQIENWRALAAALRELAESSPVAKSMASAHGAKYILDGRIGTPAGRSRGSARCGLWTGAHRGRVSSRLIRTKIEKQL